MKFTKIPENTFETLQLNAGMVLHGASGFAPATGTVTTANILGATSGGMNFTAVPSFKDLGEDIDNCPKNMKELKHVESWEIKLSGTLLTIDTATAKKLVGACDIDSSDSTKLVPRKDIASGDFNDIWWVGDYSDKNSDSTGGFVAVHMINALSTSGFSLQTNDDGKGNFAFEFTAHFSMNSQDVVPFEIYIKAGT